MILNIFTG